MTHKLEKNKQPHMKNLKNCKHKILEKNENDTIKKFNRASIILIEESYNNNSGRKEPTIILFNNRKWNVFITPGGRIEIAGDNIDDILMETAKRELHEETLNTINIDENILKKSKSIDVLNQKTNLYTRAYLVSINKKMFDGEIYYNNKTILFNKIIPFEWRETNEVDRFYISDLFACIENINNEVARNIVCKNVHGKLKIIYCSTWNIIYSMLQKNILDETLKNLNKMRCHQNLYSNLDFLIGTKTLEIIQVK